MTRIVNSFEEAVDSLTSVLSRLNNPPVSFVGQRTSDYEMFRQFLSFQNIFSLDYGRDAETIERKTNVVSFERESKVRRPLYSPNLQLLFDRDDVCEVLNQSSGMILPYSNSATLELFAKKFRQQVLATPAAIRDACENKLNVFGFKKQLGLPNPGSVVGRISLRTYQDMTSEFGNSFVVQTAHGSSGTGTRVVVHEESWKEALELLLVNEEDRCVVTPFIEGPSFSVSGVIMEDQTILLPMAVQVAGNPETARNPATFSGVDFAAARHIKADQKTLRQNLEKVCNYMRRMGYQGAVNFDVMTEGLVLTDINPRLMGSGQLITYLQEENSEITLSLLHTLTLLDPRVRVSAGMCERIQSPKFGSFIALHSLEDEVKRVTGNLIPGTYCMDGGILRFVRSSVLFSNLCGEEFVVAGAIPQKGKVVDPDAPLLRIFSKKSVINPVTFKLNSSYQNICKAVYGSLKLR